METYSALDNIIKDFVTTAYINTYPIEELNKLGLKIDANYSTLKKRYLGVPPNILYPEVIIWHPNSPSSNDGKAVLVGVVETGSSLITPDINNWRWISGLADLTFCLIVPLEKVTSVMEILFKEGINNAKVYSYQYDYVRKRYDITKQN